MKTLKIIILLLFTLFLLGCASTSPEKKEADIFTGFEGLAAEFGKNAPPLKVFEQSMFPVLLKIRNNGAQSITNNKGVLTIGREKDYIPKLAFERNSRITIVSDQKIDNQIRFNLDGKTILNSKGDEIIV